MGKHNNTHEVGCSDIKRNDHRCSLEYLKHTLNATKYGVLQNALTDYTERKNEPATGVSCSAI